MKNSLWKFAKAGIVLTMLAPILVMLLAGCEPEVTPTPAPAAPPTDTPVPSKVEGETERMVPLPMAMSPSEARLSDVTRWFYMIDANLETEMIERIAASEYDMVVLDFIPFEENNTDYPMADVIAQLHNPSHHFDCAQCKPKLVIAYVDVGQAEEYRTYWQPGWGIGNPEWIAGTDPDGWEGNYPVAFWYDEWHDIWLGENGYLQAILDAGFDGVYLDWVEAYSDENVMAIAEQEGVDPRQEMIWWIGDIADFTRDQRPDFVVIAQNAAELAEDDDYLTIIDAIAQEQVWFDGGADNEPPGDCPLPRTEAEVDSEAYRQSLSPPCRKQYDDYPDSTLHVSSEEYLPYLTLARDQGKIIFTVDYALEPDNVAWVYETSRALGFVPFVSSRGLDRYVEPAPSTSAQATPPTAPTTDQPSPPLAPSHITQVWANEGGDKVTRDELRATKDPHAVHNSVWNGTSISLFGARNEVVSFNLVLEATKTDATNVNVTLTELTGPDGATINTRPASGDDVFNYVGRTIELFYVRYLEIKGLSTDLFYAGYAYDERHIPERCRRPYDEETGEGTGNWEDRPCHNKFYPEIAVPLELYAPFTIAAGTNQSIWGDIYIPKTVPAGLYTGIIAITEDGALTRQVPINLYVRDFALPDLPNARTMLAYSPENINDRYLGEDNAYPEPGTAAYTQSLELVNRHFQLAHRHKISLIDEYIEIEQMGEAWTSRLNGELFTLPRGYDGVGVGVGNNVYSIGTYGSWPWQDGTQEDMWANTDAWINWFDAQAFATPTDYFLYLIDESDDYPQTEQWAQWIENNPGPGQRLMSMATIGLPTAAAETLSLDVPTSWYSVGPTEVWQNAVDSYAANPDKRFYMYNSNRPGSGSFAIEDEGVALRELAWGQYKMGIDRWFYWESTYYNNEQGNTGQTNVFQQAQTYGDLDGFDNVLGETGWNYLNGDGVLFYPGTDTRFPEDSYGVMGPFASLRLKHWRRGIQDVDYLTLAAEIAPERTAEIVNEIVPKVLWEVGVSDPEDPTWVLTDISWSTDPDVWEAARAELADIVEGASP